MTILTEEERKELNRLHGVISDRARKSNSIITSMEVSLIRNNEDLDLMRFFATFWTQDVLTSTVNAAYKAAVELRQHPLTFVTKENVMALERIGTFFRGVTLGPDEDAMTLMGMLLMTYPEREDYILSLVLERKITEPHEIAMMLDEAERTPQPLTGGSL